MTALPQQRSFRVMQIFQIERDYKKHKDRLLSIQHTSRNRLSRSSIKNEQAINSFRKSHTNAESFAWMNTNKKVEHQNDLLMKNIERVNKRSHKLNTAVGDRRNGGNSSRKQHFRSTSSSVRSNKIKDENKQLKKKLEKAKSNYEGIRKSISIGNNVDGNGTHASTSKKKRITEAQQKLLKLFQNQFKIKPKVMLFPKVKRQKSKQPFSCQKQSFQWRQYQEKLKKLSRIHNKRQSEQTSELKLGHVKDKYSQMNLDQIKRHLRN